MSGEPAVFDSELEAELHRVLDPMVAGSIPLRHAPARRGLMVRLLGGAGAALAAKTVTGVAIAALAAGAATEVVVTHSLNPADWAQQTLQVVQGRHVQPGGRQHSSTSPPSSTSTANTIGKPTPGGVLPPVTLPTVNPSLPVTLPSVSPLPTPSIPCVPVIATACK